MFKRKSKRNLAQQNSSSAPAGNSSKLWNIGDGNRKQLLSSLPVFLNKLSRCALGENHLFIRNVELEKAEYDDEEIEIIENAIKSYFLEYSKGSAAVQDLLEHYNVHVWANIVKEILKCQSPTPLISDDVVCNLLELATEDVVSEKISSTKVVLEDMPHSRWNILRDLCLLLRDCLTPTDKLCYVFGVILLFPREKSEDEFTSAQQAHARAEACTSTMKFLIESCAEIFNVIDDPRNIKSSVSLNEEEEEEEEDVHAVTAKSKNKPVNSVLVLYDLEANASDELPLVKGTWIQVTCKVNDDWYKGQYVSSGGQMLEGLFPGTYCDMSNFDASALGHHGSDDVLEDETPPVSHSTNQVSSEQSRSKKVIALYDYTAADHIELSIVAHETLYLLDDTDDDWWRGKNEDGQEGLFPKNYVKLLPEKESLEENGSSNVNQDNSSQKEQKSLDFDSSSSNNNNYSTPTDENRAAHGSNRSLPEMSHPHVRKPHVVAEERRNTMKALGEQRKSIGLNKPEPIARGPPPARPARQTLPGQASFKNSRVKTEPSSVTKNITLVSEQKETPTYAKTSNVTSNIMSKQVQSRSENGTDMKTNNISRNAQSAYADMEKWKIDKERFSFCVGWFMKLAQPQANGRALVPGRDAAEFLLKSGLRKDVVAQILELSDLDGDKMFDRDEFVVAHHLAISIKKGMPPIKELPPFLIPASKRGLKN